MNARHQVGAADLRRDLGHVDVGWGAPHQKVDRLANDAPRAVSDQCGDGKREQRVDVEPAGK